MPDLFDLSVSSHYLSRLELVPRYEFQERFSDFSVFYTNHTPT